MGIFDYVLITVFLASFIGSCASLGATPARPPEKDAE